MKASYGEFIVKKAKEAVATSDECDVLTGKGPSIYISSPFFIELIRPGKWLPLTKSSALNFRM